MKMNQIVDISQDPAKFKELFKKYPRNFVTADVLYKPPPPVLNINELFSNQGEGDLEGHKDPFDPTNPHDKRLANLRIDNKSDNDMENEDHPQFNSELPIFNESDKSSIAELRNFNKMLIDKMYTAYNEDADELLRRGNLRSITKKGEGLNLLEREREEELERARKNYNIAADVFGITEESDEEDGPEKRKLLKKKKVIRSQLPSTYYRDIAMIKAKRDLIKKNKKKQNREVKSEKGISLSHLGKHNFFIYIEKYKKNGVYALNQLKPLAKQEIYKQDEVKPKPKAQTREIPRTQMAVLHESPAIIKSQNPSTEPIDEEQIKFQSAEKSFGITARNKMYLGLTSIQEQPNNFALNKRKISEEIKNSPRNITKHHFDALKGNFQNKINGKYLIFK